MNMMTNDIVLNGALRSSPIKWWLNQDTNYSAVILPRIYSCHIPEEMAPAPPNNKKLENNHQSPWLVIYMYCVLLLLSISVFTF